MADQDSNLGKATPDTVLSDWPNVWHMLPTWQGTADSDRDWAASEGLVQRSPVCYLLTKPNAP